MEHPPRRRVVVTQKHFDAHSVDYLDQNGCDVQLAQLAPGQADADLDEDSLRELLADADGWIVGHAHVGASLLQTLPRLQVIARRGVGYERVDTAAVARLGKVATIAAGGNDACVADHTLAMMLALGHRLRESQRNMENGDWTILAGTDLYRKTVGIVGFGRIGQAVARRLAGFDTEILVASTGSGDRGGSDSGSVRHVDLDTLLGQSDYVTLHAPLNDATRFMIDDAVLGRMRCGAFLLNTARGGLVEDRHLLQALRERRLAGAGLDVFVSEADPTYAGVTAALLAMPNVIGSPHSAASTMEGLQRTNLIAARCVVAVLDGATPPPGCIVADGRNT